MDSIRARVRNGRLVVEEVGDLPDRTEVNVTGTDVDEALRFAAAIDAGLATSRARRRARTSATPLAGQVRPVSAVTVRWSERALAVMTVFEGHKLLRDVDG